MAKKAKAGPKPKAVNVRLIPRTSTARADRDLYALLDRTVAEHHPDLADVRIAIIWRYGLKRNKRSGQLVLGKAKKLSDLEREWADADACVILNADVWSGLTTLQQAALCDHELAHVGVVKEDSEDEASGPKRDDRGRVVLWMKPHDVQDFHAIIRRHGLYLPDLQKTAEAILASRDAAALGPTLFDAGENAGDKGAGEQEAV